MRAGWGWLEVVVPDLNDLEGPERLVSTQGYEAVGVFGEQLHELALSDEPPSLDEINDLRPMAASAEEVRALDSVGSGWAAARALHAHLTEVRVTFRRPNWCLNQAVFEREIEKRWVTVAQRMTPGTVTVGEIEFEVAVEPEPARVPILPPAGLPPDGAGHEILDLLRALADAQAWRNIATEEEVDREQVHIALHRDQRPVITLHPAGATGGLHLWRWITRTNDGNRDEALRYVLRLLTASGPPALPDALACASLAERHRIALSRDHAVEVERAIAGGRERTAARIDRARDGLASYLEDTAKTTQATLAAALAVVALGLQQSDLVPTWLLATTTTVASFGIVGLVLGRWRRIGELAAGVTDAASDLSKEGDPLLPDDERERLLGKLTAFDVDRRRKGSRRAVVIAGAVAIGVMTTAAVWLTRRDEVRQPFSEVVAVSGFYRQEGGVARLCKELAGPNPPTCQASLVVLQGLDTADVPGAQNEGGVTWSTTAVTAIGVQDGSVLRVASIASS